ncbi:MAG: hypothetical protein KDC08_13140, partial [Actinobacteria bacterium]|nr:hypothetical protein [Actinomycetota bacterium]
VGGAGTLVCATADDRTVRGDQDGADPGIRTDGTVYIACQGKRLPHVRLAGHLPSFRAREGTPDTPAARFLPSGL